MKKICEKRQELKKMDYSNIGKRRRSLSITPA